jgi:hypothetical protein
MIGMRGTKDYRDVCKPIGGGERAFTITWARGRLYVVSSLYRGRPLLTRTIRTDAVISPRNSFQEFHYW